MKRVVILIPLLLLVVLFVVLTGYFLSATAQDARAPVVNELEAILVKLPSKDFIFSKIDREVVKMLEAKSASEARAYFDEMEESLFVLLARFDAAVRTGHRDKARELLKKIAAHTEANEWHIPRNVCEFLIEQEEWEMAEEALWALAPQQVGKCFVAVERVAEEKGDDAAQGLYRHLTVEGGSEWIRFWVDYAVDNKNLEKTQAELEAVIRENPESFELAYGYLHALIEYKTLLGEMDLDWIGEVCRPRLASDSYLLGGKLYALEAYAGAVAQLERSLETELTDEDRWRPELMTKVAIGEPERMMRQGTKSLLARAYRATGREDSAKKLEAELKAEGQTWGAWPEMMQQEYAVQSPGEDKEPSQAEILYTRARKLAAEKKYAEAEEAYRNALGECPTDPGYMRTKGGSLRNRILMGYLNLLREQGKTVEQVELLKEELQVSAPESDAAEAALMNLCRLDGTIHMGVDEETGKNKRVIDYRDELWWQVLGQNEQWGYAEQKLILRMLEHVDSPARDAILIRAEKLCAGAEASRSKMLGWICRDRAPRRAIVLLKYAQENLADEGERQSAGQDLLMVYIALEMASKAEEQLGLLSRLPEKDRIYYMKKTAYIAARTSDKERAMRMWQQAARIAGGNLEGLETLAKLGMKEELREFYWQWHRDDPGSWVPTEALRTLNKVG